MIRALTLDLDDTLWPIGPVIEQAESALDRWLHEHCPDVAALWTIEKMRQLRERTWLDHPHLAHDFTALRELSLHTALGPHGYGQSHVDRALEVFFTARNTVTLYEDAGPALAQLAQRWPLGSLTNGNADLDRIGLGGHFTARICARSSGFAKPDPKIFARAAQLLGIPAAQIAHVGDDPLLDVLGAQRAGMVGVWLNRTGAVWEHDTAPDLQITRLDQLAPALEALHPSDHHGVNTA